MKLIEFANIKNYRNLCIVNRGQVNQIVGGVTSGRDLLRCPDFYFQYIQGNKNNDNNFWTNNIGSHLHSAWSGLAFERVCLQHISQIKNALGISGVLSNVYSWRTDTDDDKGIDKTQIDLLIDRNDGVINLCEMKFSAQEYAITEDEEMKLRRRRGNFISATQTKKAVHITLVTPYGLKQNCHSAIAQNEITLNNLF